MLQISLNSDSAVHLHTVFEHIVGGSKPKNQYNFCLKSVFWPLRRKQSVKRSFKNFSLSKANLLLNSSHCGLYSDDYGILINAKAVANESETQQTSSCNARYGAISSGGM